MNLNGHIPEKELLKKLKKMSDAQVEHTIHVFENEVEIYMRCVENYPPDRMERNGKPYLQMLTNKVNVAKAELAQRQA